jgi:hypothetical protein
VPTHVPRTRGPLREPPTYGAFVSCAAVRTLGGFSCLVTATWLWCSLGKCRARVLAGVLRARRSGRWTRAHDGFMDVRLLYFDGCPHWAVAEQRLRSASSSLGRGGETIRHVLVETSEDAEGLGFIGSPTILVDGHDPFASGDERPALACRVFSTAEGRAGSPTVEQLVEVLS